MNELYRSIRQQLADGQGAVLATVVDGSGSAPRGPGAQMAVSARGCQGTIGGGAVEFEAQKLAAVLLAEGRSAVRDYDLSADTADGLGMICGGKITVLFQYLRPGVETAELLDRLLSLCASGAPAWVITEIEEDGRWQTALADSSRQVMAGQFSGSPEQLGRLLKSRCVAEQGPPRFYAQPLTQWGRVYIFGGGHISQQLVPVLDRVFFPCVVLDSHPDFARQELFPQAREVLLAQFETAFDRILVEEQDSIVILTRGHRYDYQVLRQALGTPARYIGMIGSRQKVDATFDRLIREDGATYGQLRRVCAPIGLSIGGDTPQEIAISIAAQLIQRRTACESR